ncbi:hypothetical protein [Micromonospora haikouensis]|uniref:hypothetical protein n=1 Tax=Micromonospora haikouensis TaxID=686309 RepID=UPI003D729160
MLTTITLAAAAEPDRGWGGPIALAIVAAIYVAGATIHAHFRSTEDPSPTAGGDTGRGVTAQVSAVSDTDDTDADTGGWWGRIATVGGRRVRVVDDVDEDQAAAAEDQDDDRDGDQDDEDEPTIGEVIDRLEGQGWGYMAVVRHVMDEFEVSESTAKRAVREAREARAARGD